MAPGAIKVGAPRGAIASLQAGPVRPPFSFIGLAGVAGRPRRTVSTTRGGGPGLASFQAVPTPQALALIPAAGRRGRRPMAPFRRPAVGGPRSGGAPLGRSQGTAGRGVGPSRARPRVLCSRRIAGRRSPSPAQEDRISATRPHGALVTRPARSSGRALEMSPPARITRSVSKRAGASSAALASKVAPLGASILGRYETRWALRTSTRVASRISHAGTITR